MKKAYDNGRSGSEKVEALNMKKDDEILGFWKGNVKCLSLNLLDLGIYLSNVIHPQIMAVPGDNCCSFGTAALIYVPFYIFLLTVCNPCGNLLKH